MATWFNEKVFNEEVFGKYVDQIPNLRKYELMRAGAVVNRQDLASKFIDQTGGHYMSIPIKPRTTKSRVKYDGRTDIPLDKLGSYLQGRIVFGYSNGWTEDDFTYDITGKNDFLQIAASGVAEWENAVDEDYLFATLEGIFNMTTPEGMDFAKMKTYTETNTWDETTFINAIQQFGGDQKDGFVSAIMHSSIATDLQKTGLLEFVKQNDANGLQRDTRIATIDGRTVLVDDAMPFDENTEQYTTYVLGTGGIEHTNCGAKNPYGIDRDELTRGGLDFLVARRRKIYSPFGISWTDNTIICPDEDDIASGAYWDIAAGRDGDGNVDYYPIKDIKIGRIISKASTAYVPPVDLKMTDHSAG